MYPRMFTKEGSCGDCSCLSCDSSFLLIGWTCHFIYDVM